MARSDLAGLVQLVGHLSLIAVMIWLNMILSGAWQILPWPGKASPWCFCSRPCMNVVMPPPFAVGG